MRVSVVVDYRGTGDTSEGYRANRVADVLNKYKERCPGSELHDQRSGKRIMAILADPTQQDLGALTSEIAGLGEGQLYSLSFNWMG